LAKEDLVNNSGSKIKKLKEQGVLNPKAEKVTDEMFEKNEFFDSQDLLQVKYEMLRRVQKDGWTVLKASQKFGFSRPSFYKAQNDFSTKGLPGLIPRQKGPKEAHKLSADVMEYVDQTIAKDNTLKAAKIVSLLEKRFSLKVHPRSIERALARRKKKG
jgi:transposase